MVLKALTATCRCGEVELECAGSPIVGTACYCSDCREAGQRFAAAGMSSPVDESGGTEMLLFRKDRVRCVRGEKFVSAQQLTPDSPTFRMVADCCGTPMFLNYSKGFWLTVYRDRCGPEASPVTMRVMTGERPEGTALLGDMPNYAGHSGKFMVRLMLAWAAMGFRSPRHSFMQAPAEQPAADA
jgi:hypothetical protein